MTKASLSQFALESVPAPDLPQEPVLSLHAGHVGVMDKGRLLYYGQWIVAVGLSPGLFLLSHRRSGWDVPLPVLDALVGYLQGCRCRIYYVPARSPVSWRLDGDLGRIAALWVGDFLCGGQQLLYGADVLRQRPPFIVLSVGAIANDDVEFWRSAHVVLTALRHDLPLVYERARAQLWQLSRSWEWQWADALNSAVNRGLITDQDRPRLRECDQAWLTVVQEHLVPAGYRMGANTIARLL